MNQQKLDITLRLCAAVYDLSQPEPPEDVYGFYRDCVVNAKGLILGELRIQ